jgi:hypothetical protein
MATLSKTVKPRAVPPPSEHDAAHNRFDERDADPDRPAFDPTNHRGPRRSDSGEAFLPDPSEGPMRMDDDMAEMFGEDFILSATTGGGDAAEGQLDQIVEEELGGPFLETSAAEEFAQGTDESNPEDAEPEPLPRAVHGIMANDE